MMGVFSIRNSFFLNICSALTNTKRCTTSDNVPLELETLKANATKKNKRHEVLKKIEPKKKLIETKRSGRQFANPTDPPSARIEGGGAVSSATTPLRVLEKNDAQPI